MRKYTEENETVHTRHCTWNSCKYGEEAFCEVFLGYAEPLIKETEFGEEIPQPSTKEFILRREQYAFNGFYW